MEKSGAITSFSDMAADAVERRERINNLVKENALTGLELLFKEAAAALKPDSSGAIDLSPILEKLGGEQFVLHRTGLVNSKIGKIDPALEHYFCLEVLGKLFKEIQEGQRQPKTVNHHAIAESLVKVELPFLEVLDLVAQGNGCGEGGAVSLRAIKEVLEERDLNGAYLRAVIAARPGERPLYYSVARVTVGMLRDSKAIDQEFQTDNICGVHVYKKNPDTLSVRQQLLEMQSRKLCDLKDILGHPRNAMCVPVLEIIAESEDGLSVANIASFLQQKNVSSITDYWKEQAQKALDFLIRFKLVDKMENCDISRVGTFYAISYLGMNVLNYKTERSSALATGAKTLAARLGGNRHP